MSEAMPVGTGSYHAIKQADVTSHMQLDMPKREEKSEGSVDHETTLPIVALTDKPAPISLAKNKQTYAGEDSPQEVCAVVELSPDTLRKNQLLRLETFELTAAEDCFLLKLAQHSSSKKKLSACLDKSKFSEDTIKRLLNLNYCYKGEREVFFPMENYSFMFKVLGEDKIEILTLLLKHYGIDFKVNTSLNRTLLHCASTINGSIFLETLTKEHDFNINAQDILGNTPLHYAVLEGAPVNICKLIDLGAVEQSNKEGLTPLAIFIMNIILVYHKKQEMEERMQGIFLPALASLLNISDLSIKLNHELSFIKTFFPFEMQNMSLLKIVQKHLPLDPHDRLNPACVIRELFENKARTLVLKGMTGAKERLFSESTVRREILERESDIAHEVFRVGHF
ncbi:hypothetical protein HMI54_011660 [Coelomomyces lativittatus]|nr:hypothetical protein HMI54_011660 [Coelomomyces lativittatus]